MADVSAGAWGAGGGLWGGRGGGKGEPPVAGTRNEPPSLPAGPEEVSVQEAAEVSGAGRRGLPGSSGFLWGGGAALFVD